MSQTQDIACGAPVHILLYLRQQLIAYSVPGVVKGIIGGILHIGQVPAFQPLKDGSPVRVQQGADNPSPPVDDSTQSGKTAPPEKIVKDSLHLVPAVVGHSNFYRAETAVSRTAVSRTAVRPGPVLPFPSRSLFLQSLIAQITARLLLRHALCSRKAAHIYL